MARLHAWLLRTTIVGCILLASAGMSDPDNGLGPGRWTTSGTFDAKTKDGKNEYNVSGIACAGARTAPRNCLVIDDQLAAAQRATVGDHRITVGAVVPLLGAAKPVGDAPAIACDDVKSPTDLDGEAVAESAGIFYVVGSHGCGRKGAYRSSSFLIARVSPDNVVDLSYRLSGALQRCPVVGDYFGKRLEKFVDKNGKTKPDKNGLNVEGLAAMNGRLWVGLRAPSVPGLTPADNTAYIVSVDAKAIFDKIKQLGARLHAVRLGDDRGIRDLAALDDGRLLILSGPRTNAGTDYRIMIYDPRDGTTRPVAELPLVEASWKAEALLVLAEANGIANLLVLHDGAKNGGPYDISVKVPIRGPSAPTTDRPCQENKA